ncbi:hypothetical protein, partial [Corynebacterium belfantii]|uniref:hypothetical protein n=1 Tax=Corynebacterium belfantii TaxID=2014537 RepID=UPI001A7E69D0
DSTNATASALNCSEYNFGMINILPCPAPAKQARRQPNPQQTPALKYLTALHPAFIAFQCFL